MERLNLKIDDSTCAKYKIDSKKEITQKKKQEEVTDDDLPF